MQPLALATGRRGSKEEPVVIAVMCLAQEGQIPGTKLGKEWRISPSDLQEFMERHANQPMDKASGA